MEAVVRETEPPVAGVAEARAKLEAAAEAVAGRVVLVAQALGPGARPWAATVALLVVAAMAAAAAGAAALEWAPLAVAAGVAAARAAAAKAEAARVASAAAELE